MFTTLTYYNQNARSYTAATQTLDFRLIQDRFLSHMPRSARILDFGCGSGRDTRYFLNHGFQVDAVDGSSEMCRIAGEYTGIPIRQMLFQELDTVDTYDGIWACASILHLSRMELSDVFRRMAVALRKNGMIYASFKYGSEALRENETGGISRILQNRILQNSSDVFLNWSFRKCGSPGMFVPKGERKDG